MTAQTLRALAQIPQLDKGARKDKKVWAEMGKIMEKGEDEKEKKGGKGERKRAREVVPFNFQNAVAPMCSSVSLFLYGHSHSCKVQKIL